MKQNLVALLCSILALTACAKSKTESAISEPTSKHSVSSKQDPVLQKRIDQLVEKTKKNMIFVEGGEYLMGDFGLVTPELEKTVPNSAALKNPKGNTLDPHEQKLPFTPDDDNKPPHKVILDSFEMTNNKITLADFLIYLDANNITHPEYLDDYPKAVFDKLPAGANWQQSQNYCIWLGKQIGKKMNLPTEAQWEYAARNKGQYVAYATNNGNIENGVNVFSFSQYREIGEKYRYHNFSHLPVLGETPPNPLGFYDMVTNNKEWMFDWYDANYYKNSEIKNPKGPNSGEYKVVRSSLPQGGDNAKHGEGINFVRKKADPKAVSEGTDGKIRDASESFSFRCTA
ncbi:formylglycine-generating enzyme family protein [Acinetobacter sp. DSM 11652]|uniref:formylglycine-generating enzyme family protein n=1 Tax=Acinetobacter sp. DSM 11652 TaxID=346222 RepID=UPI0008B26EB9|nr:SUMF1/EgtB/PvdO family nonheme iron enzyme [Acinetobacter sp. DSM 11652]SEM03210.1 Sulfatase-modifying factor enzyme 1 [Acinetobacter sp. DSM 11652]